MNIRQINIKGRIYLIITGVIALFAANALMNTNVVNKLRDMGIQKTGILMLENQKEKLRVATHSLALVIGHALEGVRDEDQQVQTIRRLIEDVRFESDRSAYFFVFKNTVSVAHPVNKDLQGTDMSGVKDQNNVYLVKELYQAASKGGGFVSYSWAKPGAGETPKISYSEKIPNTTMWLGTGVYLDNIDRYQTEMAQELQRYSKNKGRQMLVLEGIFLVGILGLCLFIGSSISRRLSQMVTFAGRLAEGDFTCQMQIRDNDEIGMAGRALNRMVGTLGALFREVNNGVGTLNSSSTDLAEIALQLTGVSEQTSVKSQTVASAAEEMSTNMENVAAASEQASTNVNIAANCVEEMSTTVKEISKNSESARNITGNAVARAQSASLKVDQLGTAASAISKVIEVINDISEQTNLLALNATIEAARAGEAGKGFAVVANEIKELARQTATATGEIKAKVEGIQTASTQTVEDIKEISRVIAEINGIISGIAAAVEEQSTAAGDISANVLQASQGIGAVNSSVAESAAATQQISKEIGEMTGSAGELAVSSSQVSVRAADLQKLADRLSRSIEKFRIKAAAFDIGKIKTAHLKWRTRLEAVLHGQQTMTPEEVTSHRKCDFGKWYDSVEGQALAHHTAFKSIGNHHESVHRLARKIVDAVHHKDTSNIKQLFAEFETHREKMFAALDELYRG